ncbi:DNA damage response protein RcaA [Aspergillus heteromorphus CBS 117.55]|uniref:DNA damage response protein RcaA n=1 Tax=Aspergillus heteromorphus CBS 117.55 TaxID=1448321 RepID=A0A317VVM6_9EURO|nr:DNA damage response protein RcaA [Aspergillus heteromorphus CBS 117.55]PWY77022.1 DNA damage response protein RcaA [Aspergillus heteromorphus CBS 117.55]
MWILDSEGDFLGGARVWLRPGKKYLFGRIKQADVRHAIDHKTISRRHMVIEVSPVKPGDGSHIYTRSEIAVCDLASKCGTTVDGDPVRERRTLTDEEHEIKLGRYEHVLRIKWQPAVLSFSLSSRELRAKDPLARVRSRVEDLDIKTIVPYVVDQTTHVVQTKRNTAKGLQALVNGKFIVQDSYIDALVYAATPSDLENLESLSPLEANFDAAWPDARQHLPPPGKEVTQRPKEAFAPVSSRIDVFEGYTFIFADSAQFANLQDAIGNGHGKALFYEVQHGVTNAEDIVEFMKKAAGDKGLGSQRNGPGGVVFVRYRTGGPHEDWWIELSHDIARMTDQRVIEQSEFLDAILGNDAAPLCRTLVPESTARTDAPASQPDATPSDVPMVEDSQPSEEPPQTQAQTKRSKPRVRAFVSKMKTFDDGFDLNSIPAHAPDDEVANSPVEMGPLPQSQPQSSVDEEDVFTNLLPGSSAMKRRRAETVQRTDAPAPIKEEVPRPKRQKLDVLEAARQHREAEDDARRQAEAVSLQGPEDVNVEKLKGLAIVEEMEVKPRNSGDDSRWDERWNGRKNFKKFRRKGDSSQPRYRIQTVIVPLEEVTRKEFGIGDHYWVSTTSRPSPERQAERQAASPVEQPDSEATPSITARVESETPAPKLKPRSQRSQKRGREEEEEDSDDEMRFRFRRRR